jgi:acyl-coenzyme A thioesterase PaaI-like protein
MSVITKSKRPPEGPFTAWPHPNCFVCGEANRHGLRLEFILAEDGTVHSSFCCKGDYEGYPGILHGGIVSSIVDGAMTNCLFAHEVVAVTAELAVRFRSPVVVGRQTTVWAKIIRKDSPLYVVEAKITQDGKTRVTATGKFLEKPDIFEKTTL